MKTFKLTISIVCYAIGLVTIAYYIDFFTGFIVPKSINSGSPDSFLNALFVDLLLLILFGLQHTLMARTGFKRWFASVFPKSLTRSVYILLTCLTLGLLIWFWQPIPLTIYDYRNSLAGDILLGMYYLGWAVGLLSSFEIDHFELFGIRQVFSPKKSPTDQLKAPFFYRLVRHPNYLGWILIHWMTPMLTIGHLLFAAGITAYIYIGLVFEERDLIKHFGDQYLAYKKVTPKLNPLLFPFKKLKGSKLWIRSTGLLMTTLLLA